MKLLNIIIVLMGILILLPSVSAIVDTYSMPIAALTSTPAKSVTTYFGYSPSGIPGLMSNQSIVFIPQTGYIDTVEIYDYSGTAGTNEAYSYYIRINNTTDYLIKTLSLNTNERIFSNTSINIPVNVGDWWEIKRVQPNWVTQPATNIVGGYVFLNTSATTGFYIPIEALTLNPTANQRNYMGYRPVAASTAQGTNKIYIREDGNITVANIVMNASLKNGTSEVFSYYVQKNGGDNTWIGTYNGFNGTFRNLTNKNVGLHVEKGDYLEVYRDNSATWAVAPTGVIDTGGLWVDTSQESGCKPDGYKLYAQALTSSPTDAQTVYFGSKLSAPDTTAARDKLFVRKAGFINFTKMYVYSGTAGTAENWNMYIRKNNVADYFISRVNSSANERIFRNATISIPVAVGDYIQFKGVQPTWATNPATTIYGGWVYVETASVGCGGGGDIVLPPVSDFSANITSTGSPAIIQFFDQSNNTVPGTTTYEWNFTNGGTGVDSTDINPTFTYGTPGTYTINHTISSSGTVSTKSKTITITGSSATAPPNASFNIVLTDTSTNVPTSWKWNATNLLGNNTEVTFSTAQNPVMNFGTGNWRINLTVTNAFGSNTTNQTIGWNLSSPKVYFWSRTA